MGATMNDDDPMVKTSICRTAPIYDPATGHRWSFQNAYIEAWAKASNECDRWVGGENQGKVHGTLHSSKAGGTWLKVCIEITVRRPLHLKLGA
jgi:hypothetical protein